MALVFPSNAAEIFEHKAAALSVLGGTCAAQVKVTTYPSPTG